MCQPIDVCHDCKRLPPTEGDKGLENCTFVENLKYYISDYYEIKGVDQMKAEIYAQSPIDCAVHLTYDFNHNYTGGIHSEDVGII